MSHPVYKFYIGGKQVIYMANPDERPTDVIYEDMPTGTPSDEIFKLLLDRSKMPEIMSHTLKGEVWAIEEKKGNLIGSWVKRGEPLMNEKGIRFFSSFFFSAMSPDKIATFLTEAEVNRMAKDMSREIIYIIVEKGDIFGIDPSNRSYIVELMDHFYFANLTASRQGTILKFLKPTVERKEIYTPRRETGTLGGLKVPFMR